MRWSSLTFAGLCLLTCGCGEGGSNASFDMNSPAAAAMGAVSEFRTPALQGLIVANDPEGAVVVSSPADSPPGVTVLGEYPVGTVFTAVNGTRVRDAAHFRDLTDEVFESRRELNLAMIANARP